MERSIPRSLGRAVMMSECLGSHSQVIEVEKKVFLTSEQREQLVASLPLGKEKAL